MCAPGIYPETPFAPHARQIGAVKQLEHEPKALLELGLPLLQDGWRCCDYDRLCFFAEKKFSSYQSGLDCLTKTGIIGNEKVDTWQTERLSKWLHLVCIDFYSGAERCLK